MTLAGVEYVDPARIYLGGHSTGGTLVLLAAACTDRFRAVFSFGPVDDPAVYGSDFLPFDTSDRQELKLRTPRLWLQCIGGPVFVIEGTVESNIQSLQVMERLANNANLHFLAVQGADHFNVLAPANRLLAQQILQDNGPTSNITLSSDEILRSMSR